MSTTADKHQAKDKGIVIPQAFCMECDGPASKDAHGNWWHTEGCSDRCAMWESVKALRFVSHASPEQEKP